MTDPRPAFPTVSIGTPVASPPVVPPTPVAETTPTSDMLTPTQAAEYLKVAEGTLTVWRSTKKGPPYSKTGNRRGAIILYKKSDLDEFNKNTKIKRRKERKD